MNAESKETLSLKVRSKSMPLVHIQPKSPRFYKLKKNKSKVHEEMQLELLHNKQFFDLQNIKDQQAEEINTKIKILAERSMKKLEERYETIDKWKQKYVPQCSVMLIRQKLSLDNNSIKLHIEQKSPNLSETKQVLPQTKEGNKLLPVIIKKHLTPTIPDQRQQGKRLQQMLRERLQRNKKYYELKSTIIQKEINYFQEMNTFIAPQKKRELQLRKLLLKAQKDRANNRGLFYQKISLSEPKVNRQVRNKNIRILFQKQKSNLNDQRQVLIKKNPSEKLDLKAKLMQQVIGATPQGWNTTNQLYSPQQQQYLS